MSNMLFARTAGEGEAVLLLHGLFGSGSNLGALARSLQARYCVYAVDLPGHGRSGWLASYSLQSMAAQVVAWLDEQALPAVHVLGHSLGGKLAMQLALGEPQRVRSLLVADIAPVAYPPKHAPVFAALRAVAQGRPQSREAAMQLMRPHLIEEAVLQFLASSLQRDANGGYGWRLDHLGLERDYAALCAAPEGGAPWQGAALFVRGGESGYLRDSHKPAIATLLPAAKLETLPGCGHWLHAEQPQQFNAVAMRFLGSLADAPATR